MHWYHLLLGLWTIALVPTMSAATTFTWNSGATGNWTNPARWTPNGVPGSASATDQVVVGMGAGSGGTVILNSAVPSIATFSIGADGPATLQVLSGASLTTTGTGSAIGLNGEGTVAMSGGVLSLGGRLDVDTSQITQTGGSFLFTNPTLGNLNLAIDGRAEWNLTGTSQLDVAGSFNLGAGGEGVFTQHGGMVRVRQNLRIPLGGQGDMTVSSGTLQVDQTLDVGAAGLGTLNILGAAATINADTLRVRASGTLAFDIGASITPVHVRTADLAGTLGVDLTVNPVVGASYPIIFSSGAAAQTTTFASRPQGSVFFATSPSGAVPLRINYAANLDAGTTANDVTLTIVRNGDANLDGLTNRADLAKLMHGFGAAGGFTDGDFNGDGVVGLLDAIRWRNNLSLPVAAAAIPEPSGLLLALLATAAAGLAAMRRRR